MTGSAMPLTTTSADDRVLVRLRRLCAGIVESLAVDGIAVSRADGHSMSLVVSTEELYGRLERTQHFYANGPTILAHTTSQPEAVEDLSTQAHRWPELCALAQQARVQSVLTVPVTAHGGVGVVLSLYSRALRLWDAQEITAIGELARRYLGSESEPPSVPEPASHDGRWVETRPVPLNVRTATLLLAQQRNVGHEVAANLLARLANQTGMSVGAVADAVLRTQRSRITDQSSA